jgi:hypothetical protein
MFQNDELKNHLETSFSVESEPALIAEWNMNIPDNIQKLGNYRYRESSTQYSVLPNVFDPLDLGNFYTGATDADISVLGGLEEDETTPQVFIYPKEKEKMLYSLEDCLKPFRPRSGINKLAYFNNRYLSFPNENMFLRPRYYMPNKDDEFKYWRSYRTETDPITKTNSEYGISKNNTTGRYVIEDTNPFVAYQEAVPANRIVIKVQTNTSNINLGPFRASGGGTLEDPFFGESKKTVPSTFKIQYLNESDQWVTAYSFNETSLRDDNISPIFGADGHLSLEYGIEVPIDYKNNFRLVDTVKNSIVLPSNNIIGRAYLVVPTENSKGMLHVFNGQTYDIFTPSYRWFIGNDGAYENTHFVTDFTNPSYYKEPGANNNSYREFVFIKGIRIAVETMNTPSTPLELIEMSPRLVANLSNSLIDFSVTKAAADLGSSSLPVGQIMAGTGDLTLFDNDESFNTNNKWNFDTQTGSIIAKYIERNIKFVFYEVIKNVKNSNYYVPIKTLYSEGFPERDAQTGETTLSLRDFYFYFESLKAPRILLTEVSLSQAVCIILDSIGFSNYVFKRRPGIADPIIPNFFIAPEQSVAEVLAQLSRATQSAMFFDEYNNFVVMTKEYILDDSENRSLDTTMYGSSTENKLPNIIEISSQDKTVFNAGTINFTSRKIERTGGSLRQNIFTDRSYIYKPSLLWEVSGEEKTSSSNTGEQSGYVLSAVPLNTDLSNAVPSVSVNGELINNTFDIGENAYWLARFQGFFYANGEIIKYDAVEYAITGNIDRDENNRILGNIVWISSNQEYQKYFSKLPFNGKMYPTGLVRIFADPYYETITGISITQNNQQTENQVRFKPGSVVSHGRGQFGTPVVNHKAGLDSYWTSNNNIQGCKMNSKLLFTTEINPTIPETIIATGAGLAKNTAIRSQRNGIIRNFLSSKYSTETEVSSLKTAKTGTIQSSALVMTGPDFSPNKNPRDHVSYVYKKLEKAFVHFGTRLRIIGKIEPFGDRTQTVLGGMTYLNIPSTDSTQSISVGGGSAGINLVNPRTNYGYYFEIAALTASNIEELLERNDSGEATVSVENILFYKIKSKTSSDSNDAAIPVKLWGGIGNILVDDGSFAGQYRFSGEENPTVYDLAIEYVDVNETRRDFYLYINQKLIARITDKDPIPLTDSSVGLFVRGNTKAMFENIYALGKNYATNTVFDTNTPIAKVFGDSDNRINAIESLNKYALSGVIQNTYLDQINPTSVPGYDLYFEEFGTIMREAAYFNVKYDRAFPALYAKIAPTFNKLKGYTVSGFTADSYGAEFLVFNNTDTILKLDPSTNNALRILGVAFTGENTTAVTVDDFLKRKGSTSDPEIKGLNNIQSPFKFTEQYEKVRQSRILYGKNDFTLDSIYIQDLDTAENLLEWIINKNIRPRKSIGLNIFSMPTLQLGDIVNVYYKNSDGIDLVTPETTRYVVYNINYSRSVEGPAMTVYLSEV